MRHFAFIDGQNVHLAIRDQGWKLDWKRFRIYLTEHYGVEKAFLFLGYLETNISLYTYLQEAGFICVFKPVLKYSDGRIKGNVDAELVLHTMIEYPSFDKAMIVTGDGDFYCLVEYLSHKEKLSIVLVPNQNHYSALLKRFARKNIEFMNNLRRRLSS